MKKFITAVSSHAGAFDTSTTTDAPTNASARPSPVRVLTPVFGAAATASWPCSPSFATTFDPIRPVPPITTIFTTNLPVRRGISCHPLTS
ncbi:hypothetical protein NCC78_13315 [Micromonospora phytophila]|nr:hypothetical protein [Micromonospora phytophila]